MPADPTASARRVSPDELPPELRARYEQLKAKAKADLDAGLLGPPVERLDLDRENAVLFYPELRAYVAELREARAAAGLTLAQVADKTGLAAAALSDLETGRLINPTWRTLGLYAAAVGRKLNLTTGG